MAEASEISWTDATYNPWIGCTKVGPGCDHCYAERDFDLRKGRVKWGAGNPRSRTKTERQPHTWNNAHAEWFAEHGRKRRVFAASLADIFDNEVPANWRHDFWNTVAQTPLLEWYIVTKRVSNVERMLPDWWNEEQFRHVVLIVTVVNQDEANRDIPRLLAIKSKFPWLRVGLSIEPMLGPIDLRSLNPGGVQILDALDGVSANPHYAAWPHLDWVICGGESGPHARPMHPAWLRSLRDQCAAAGVPFHFKQFGEWAPVTEIGFEDGRGVEAFTFQSDLSVETYGGAVPFGTEVRRVGKRAAGRSIDGKEHDGFPVQP